MKSYPVDVPRDTYRGADARKQRKSSEYNRIAARVEKYINDDLASKPDDSINQYMSGWVAIHLKEDSAVVQRIIFSIDCGHNGVTIVKGDYQRAMERLSSPAQTKTA